MIKFPSEMPCALQWSPIDGEWLKGLEKKWWATNYPLNPLSLTNSPEMKLRIRESIDLRDFLLKFGGDQVCIPAPDPDARTLMERGQFWYGDHPVLKEGAASRCHANASVVWKMSQDTLQEIQIVTGYALSEDGMWRQHSWCNETTDGDNRIIETTVPRIGYFGYILTDQEAEMFSQAHLEEF